MFHFIRLIANLKSLSIRTSCLCVLAFSVLSCVGTIEEASKDKTLTQKVDKSSVIFQGVETLVSVSHNKIEVYFYPAKGGSGKFTYKIYYGGEPLPRVTSSDVLNTDYRGLLRYTLTGLDPAKDYIIRVDVQDQISGDVTNTDKTLTESTYSNKVSDFYGISEISNLAGVDGIDSIKVRWTHAECYNPLRCDQGFDPERYEVIVLDKTNKGLTPADFNNRDLSVIDGRIVKTINYDNSANTTVIRGLSGSSDYYVVVRSIHIDSLEDINAPKLRGERNNSYLQIKTLDDKLSSINFDTSSLVLSKLSGDNSRNSLKAEWTSAVGVFDHYRLFYVSDLTNLNSGNIPDNCQSTFMSGDDARTTILCKKVGFSQSSIVTTDLLQETNYQFMLVLCQNVECSAGNRIIADKAELATDLIRPEFGGLTDIKEASKLSDINSFKLQFSPIDTSDTYIDGYVIEYKNNADPSLSADYEVFTEDDPSHTDGNIFYEEFDIDSSSSIKVVGIQYYTTETYCFRIFPYVFDAYNNRVVYENNNWKCASSPEYQEPTEIAFRGLRATITQSDQVTLRWELPTYGIYEEFELYYVNNSSGLDLFGSIPTDLDSNTSLNYGRFIISPGQTEITLSGFINADSYKFGILTNFNSSQGKLRSEESENIVSCDFTIDQSVDCTGGY